MAPRTLLFKNDTTALISKMVKHILHCINIILTITKLGGFETLHELSDSDEQKKDD